jgi:ABC-type Fe3+/spermidine/putrescine transport system ATPase subunit
VMRQGCILQEATPKELYMAPNSEFVAQFIGQVNLFQGSVADTATDTAVVQIDGGQLSCHLPKNIFKGDSVLVAVRPENFRLSRRPGKSEENVLEGKVVKVVFLGDFIDCQIQVGQMLVRTRVHPDNDVAEEDPIFLLFQSRSCVVLPCQEG